MVNKIIVVSVLAAAVVAGLYILWPSEESRVKETFEEIAAALDKSGNESTIDALGKARRAVALVEPGSRFEAFDRSITLPNNPSDITPHVVAFRNLAANMHFAFEDIEVKLSGDDRAEVTCDFFYTGDDVGLSVRDARALDATLHKDPESGRWRFVRVRLSNIIEK